MVQPLYSASWTSQWLSSQKKHKISDVLLGVNLLGVKDTARVEQRPMHVAQSGWWTLRIVVPAASHCETIHDLALTFLID